MPSTTHHSLLLLAHPCGKCIGIYGITPHRICSRRGRSRGRSEVAHLLNRSPTVRPADAFPIAGCCWLVLVNVCGVEEELRESSQLFHGAVTQLVVWTVFAQLSALLYNHPILLYTEQRTAAAA